MPDRSAFHDLPAGAFPFSIEFVNALGVVVHSITVSGPGAVEIPGLRQRYGAVSVRLRFADGTVHEAGPPLR